MLPTVLCATQVTPSVAQQVAQNFINTAKEDTCSQTNRMLHAPRRLQRHPIQVESGAHFYIFNSEDNNGFVIVSGDDCITPILGYSTEGNIDPNNLPIQLDELLQMYSEEIQYAIENNLQATDSINTLWKRYKKANQANNATPVVNALISTKWDQSPYYNLKCPSDASLSSTGGHPSTGCVATAMAQIMKYWEYPTTGIGFKSYNSQYYGTLSANFTNTTYDWGNMPLKLSSSTSSTQNNAVATLMYHCGVAVEMNYNCDNQGSSGAYVIDYGGGRASAEKALKTYFGYASTITGKSWNSNVSTTTWKNILKNELNNYRPILYAGYSSSGGGHAFICDGYDSNDMFHFNWGWGGSSNGFFALTALTSSGFNYSNNQQAVIGIKPKDGSGPAKNYDLYMNTDLTATNTSSSGTNTYYFGNTISFTAKVENNGTGIFNGSFKVAAFTNDGEFIGWSKESYHFSLEAGQKTVQKTFTFDGGIPFIPGKYRAYMYYQDDDESECKLVKTDEGIFLTEYNNVAFTIKSSSDLQPVSAFIPDEIFCSFTTGSKLRIYVDVRNTALFTTFYGKIRLCLYNPDGTRAQIIEEIDFSNGFPSYTTFTLDFFNFIEVDPGTYYLALTYQKSGETSWYYMGCNTSYPNPTPVIIKAQPLYADDFEVNNTQSTATLLSWDIDPELADFSTLWASLHEDSDIDYYKLDFQNSYRYKIEINLYDKYNQGSFLWYNTADAQFAYSIGSNNYSDYYKNSRTITFNGPATLYIKVKQYGSNGLGYYELAGNVEEFVNSGIDNIENDDANKKAYKIIRDGQIFIIQDNKTYSIQGQRIK